MLHESSKVAPIYDLPHQSMALDGNFKSDYFSDLFTYSISLNMKTATYVGKYAQAKWQL